MYMFNFVGRGDEGGRMCRRDITSQLIRVAVIERGKELNNNMSNGMAETSRKHDLHFRGGLRVEMHPGRALARRHWRIACE